MKPYENLSLEDMPGEEWVDAFGFDGLYQVSNLGRIKSNSREVITRWGTPRIKSEKILKQSFSKKKGRVEGLIISLSINLSKKSKNVSRLIYDSFHTKDEFKENECVMHINKVLWDNRIENLQKTTRSKSRYVDVKKSIPTQKSLPKNIKKAQKSQKEFFKSRTHKKCSSCGIEQKIELFPDNISRCRECLNKEVIDRRNSFKPKKTKRICNKCKKEKPISEFWKNINYCRPCKAKMVKSWRDKKAKEKN